MSGSLETSYACNYCELYVCVCIVCILCTHQTCSRHLPLCQLPLCVNKIYSVLLECVYLNALKMSIIIANKGCLVTKVYLNNVRMRSSRGVC